MLLIKHVKAIEVALEFDGIELAHQLKRDKLQHDIFQNYYSR
jgi:hypothetical protein